MAAAVASAQTRDSIVQAARRRLQADGHSGWSTRKVADEAGVPLSQLHYHFGSKRGLVLAVLEDENSRRVTRQTQMYSSSQPLWLRYEQACDFFEDDLDSGYVRILHEMVSIGWVDEEVAALVRAFIQQWLDVLTEVASEAEERWGSLGPFTPTEVSTLIGNAFLGSESMLLLGFDRHSMPIRSSLRRFGALIRTMEEAHASDNS